MPAEVSKTAQFNSVYYETHKKLYSTVLKLCRDEEQTFDILQKVYLQLWEKWDTVKDKSNLYPLLFTYAKNMYIDDLRRECRRREAIEDIARTAEISGPDGESQIKRKEYMKAINMVISRLTSRRREVVQLYLDEGLTRKKIAEHLSVSPNTIDNHLQESLNILRRELQPYLETGID
ncbi:RNA polymerase sigma factor [Desertivirga xinjiangensis]|uniref:RNA polymerase sigma factor n=1 Tax=Desertivirga xinjiangensis TaxID=539206 RepID=UPI00210A18DD|nr:sigma-70 family RNA polymerase sigma factor [Pedobacter xinjiangensis]